MRPPSGFWRITVSRRSDAVRTTTLANAGRRYATLPSALDPSGFISATRSAIGIGRAKR
jgi:hypothetical protein